MRSNGLVEAVEQASALLAPFTGRPADRTLAGDVVGALTALAELESHLDVLRLKHLAAFDAENLGPTEGVPNAAVFYALQAGCPGVEARADAHLGRRLFTGDLTRTGEALERREVTLGQARAIHVGTRRLLPDDVDALEPILLACPALAPEQLHTVARAALDRISGDSGRDERAARVQARRGVDHHQVGLDGGWFLSADLDDETGQLLQGQLDELSQPVRDADGNPDPRSARERRHDAFREILRRAVRANPHEPTLPAALVTVTITLDELRALQAPADQQPAHLQELSRQCCDADLTWALVDPHPEHLGLPPDRPTGTDRSGPRPGPRTGSTGSPSMPDRPARGGEDSPPSPSPSPSPTPTRPPDPPPPDPPPPDQPPSLHLLTGTDRPPPGREPALLTPAPRGTGTASTEAILRAALGGLAPAFGGIPTDVLLLGRTQRLASRAQRRALAIRDGGCVWPGCQAPPSRCRVHHVQWWEHGGPTDLDNECLLCEYHHVRVHQGWALRRRPDHTWTVSRPTGAAQAA